MNPHLIVAASRAGEMLPNPLLRQLVRSGVGEARVALCFHRVLAPGAKPSSLPQMAMAAAALEELVELFLAARSDAEDRWLTVSFDDGYDDAAQWLAANAGRFPQVDFLFFVCPTKAERGAAFRWDLEAWRRRRGLGRRAPQDGSFDLAGENSRPDLRRVGRERLYRIASLARCRALAKLSNVRLGNHTNNHFLLPALTRAQAREELTASVRDFERLFGPARDFAIPYGTPRLQFGEEHVRILRELGVDRIWSSEHRPYGVEECRAGAVLPRFAIDGTLAPARSALLIAAWSMRYRVLGTRGRAA